MKYKNKKTNKTVYLTDIAINDEYPTTSVIIFSDNVLSKLLSLFIDLFKITLYAEDVIEFNKKYEPIERNY